MESTTLACSKCHTPLAAPFLMTARPFACQTCEASLQVYIFPALLQPQRQGGVSDASAGEGRAGCFYHPHRQAVVPCTQCGRFLCHLCDVEFHGQHWCLTCVETGKTTGALPSLTPRRLLHDSIALRIAILPSLLLWPTLLSAPIAIFYTLRHWRSPGSLIPRTKIRFVVALLIAVLQMVAWAWVFFRPRTWV